VRRCAQRARRCRASGCRGHTVVDLRLWAGRLSGDAVRSDGYLIHTWPWGEVSAKFPNTLRGLSYFCFNEPMAESPDDGGEI